MLRGFAALVVGGTLLSACTPAPGASSPTPGANLPSTPPSAGQPTAVTFGAPNPVGTLNPLLLGAENLVAELIFEPLVKPDPTSGMAIPHLAQAWDTSPDGLTWTFHLRPNVSWSDGQVFTAEDVRFTFDAALNPNVQIANRSLFANVADYDAPDAATFRVTLKQAECPFLVNTMMTPILPRQAAADDFTVNRPVGTGPFVFKERVPDDHLTLVANPTYWRGRPKIDQWIHRATPNQNALPARLKLGEIDYAKIAATNADELRAQPNLYLLQVSSPSQFFMIAYNLDRPLFQDKRVRLALTQALDRQTIVNTVLFGLGQVMQSIIPAQSWAYSSTGPAVPYDVMSARQLMAEAGWTPAADGVLQKDGVRFAFTLINGSGSVAKDAVCVIAQDAWKKTGVEMQILTLEGSAWTSKFTLPGPKDFDAILVPGSVGSALDPDETKLLASTQYLNGGNFMHYVNPTVDQLLAQGRAVPGCDLSARKAIYAQVQQQLADDHPFTMLYTPADTIAINKRVQNVTPNPWTPSPYLAASIKDWTVTS